eukprot:TRINITY_DN11709_c0_g1_i1.p1 TRINITY_DN11709_c0_g1~~TRINITY_DN11709_c0_g1_i1.p1  ORF type:complete len:138 (-),score=39.59 TRINITY_DN11709_c0_g1_i1:92-505(-)
MLTSGLRRSAFSSRSRMATRAKKKKVGKVKKEKVSGLRADQLIADYSKLFKNVPETIEMPWKEGEEPDWVQDLKKYDGLKSWDITRLNPDVDGYSKIERKIRRAKLRENNNILKVKDFRRSKSSTRKRGFFFPKDTV